MSSMKDLRWWNTSIGSTMQRRQRAGHTQGASVMAKTWFITGSSRGFGREWAEAALERGDHVAATARDITQLAPLAERDGDAVVQGRLDVTDRAAVHKAVRRAHSHFGSLDIAVNNAGYGHFG